MSLVEKKQIKESLRVWSSKFLTSDQFLRVNSELSGVDYSHKHLIRTKFATSEKSKNTVCMVKICQNGFRRNLSSLRELFLRKNEG